MPPPLTALSMQNWHQSSNIYNCNPNCSMSTVATATRPPPPLQAATCSSLRPCLCGARGAAARGLRCAFLSAQSVCVSQHMRCAALCCVVADAHVGKHTAAAIPVCNLSCCVQPCDAMRPPLCGHCCRRPAVPSASNLLLTCVMSFDALISVQMFTNTVADRLCVLIDQQSVQP
jgi:hypothetical protein